MVLRKLSSKARDRSRRYLRYKPTAFPDDDVEIEEHAAVALLPAPLADLGLLQKDVVEGRV